MPIVTTSYTPIATGGAGVNPLNSFQFKAVGINVDITPQRVTLEGDIIMDLTLESSSRAATSTSPARTTRRSDRGRSRDACGCATANRICSRACCATTNGKRSLVFPARSTMPILKQLFSNNDQTITQTDIVMLLTPHIVRAPEITEQDLQPVFLGSQNNLGIGGPPPLIAGPADNPGGVGGQPCRRHRRRCSAARFIARAWVHRDSDAARTRAAAATTRRRSGRPASRRGAAAADRDPNAGRRQAPASARHRFS